MRISDHAFCSGAAPMAVPVRAYAAGVGLAIFGIQVDFILFALMLPGVAGFVLPLVYEWVILTNLLGLLLGFSVLFKHFEKSRIPAWLRRRARLNGHYCRVCQQSHRDSDGDWRAADREDRVRCYRTCLDTGQIAAH